MINIRFTNYQQYLPLKAVYNPDNRVQIPTDIRFVLARINKVVKHKKQICKTSNVKQTVYYKNLNEVSYTFKNLIDDILKIPRSKKFKYAIYFNEFNNQSYIFNLEKYK